MQLNPLSLSIAFFMAIFSIVALRHLALRIGLVDLPGGEKKHAGSVPLIGGLCMFLGFGFALLTVKISLIDYRSLLEAMLLIIFAGVLDDFHELAPKHKVVAQLFAVLLIVLWGKTQLYSLGNLLFFGPIHLSYLSIPITVFAIVGMINAMNMIDGIDGLAGSVSLVQSLLLLYLCYQHHMIFEVDLLGLLSCVLLAFLLFNFPLGFNQSRKIFMGDAGSMWLGLLFGWFAVRLSQAPNPVTTPVTMLWVMAIPLFDAFAAIARRLLRGHSVFVADKAHIHDFFLQVGFGEKRVVLIITSLAILLGIIGITLAAFDSSEGISFILFLLLAATYLYAMAHAGGVKRYLRRRLIRSNEAGLKK